MLQTCPKRKILFFQLHENLLEMLTSAPKPWISSEVTGPEWARMKKQWLSSVFSVHQVPSFMPQMPEEGNNHGSDWFSTGCKIKWSCFVKLRCELLAETVTEMLPEKRNAKDVFINYADEWVSFRKWRIPALFLLLWKLFQLELWDSCSGGIYLCNMSFSDTWCEAFGGVMENKLCVGVTTDLYVWHFSVTW